MMTRKQKIELLKGIAKGERSISELNTICYVIWMCIDNKTYVNFKTNETLLIDEYKKRYGNCKAMFITLNIE